MKEKTRQKKVDAAFQNSGHLKEKEEVEDSRNYLKSYKFCRFTYKYNLFP